VGQDTIALEKKTSTHAISFELGGKALFYSFNYEYRFKHTKKWNHSAMIGLAFSQYIAWDFLKIYYLPFGISSQFGNKKAKLELQTCMGLQVLLEPYPLTRKERIAVRKDPNNWGGPYRPPLDYYFIPGIGLHYDFSKKLFVTCSVSIYYRPPLNDFNIELIGRTLPWPGLKIGYKL